MIEIIEKFENKLKEYQVLFFDKVWEKNKQDWKLVYNIQGLTTQDTSMFYPNLKIVFWLNNNKTKLSENVVTYLYEQYCDYRSRSIENNNIDEVFKFILDDVKNAKTNKYLSGFILDGTDNFNKIIKRDKIDDFITDLQFIPQGNKSCLETYFGFKLESNKDTYYFNLKVLKEGYVLNMEDTTINIQLKEVYEKIIELIYGVK